jgi:pimeloyl-ACP methyl ester carboxylesterase
MQYLGVACAHVVGHSYGGTIALQLALDAPEAVHSLALLEPALLSAVPGASQFMEAMGPVLQMYEAGNKAGVVGMQLWGTFDHVILAEYHGRYDGATVNRKVKDIRQGVFHHTHFASPQGSLLPLTPHDSLGAIAHDPGVERQRRPHTAVAAL